MDDVAHQFLQANQTLINLAIALLLGAIVGLERGWDAREQKAGERIAGIRTFALIGLLGGISAVLAEAVSPWVFPVLLLGVVAMGLVAYSQRLEHIRNFSITGLVGMVLTFCFGALAVAVDPVMATSGAVVTAIILDSKATIHSWVQKLQANELDAALKLLLYGPALYLWRVHSRRFQVTQPSLAQNPLDLSSALSFGALLTVVLLLGQFLEDGFGDAGIYALAAASGVADVDAITLSLTRLSNDGLAAHTAVLAIVLAATVNNLVKTGMAWSLGNRQTGLLVAGPMVLSLGAGLLIAWLQ